MATIMTWCVFTNNITKITQHYGTRNDLLFLRLARFKRIMIFCLLKINHKLIFMAPSQKVKYNIKTLSTTGQTYVQKIFI